MPETQTIDIAALLEAMNADPPLSPTLPTSGATLDEVSTYDFARYEFVLDPFAAAAALPDALTDEAIDYLDELQASGASRAIVEYMTDLLLRMETAVRAGIADGLPSQRPSSTPLGGLEGVPFGANVPEAVLRPLYTQHRRLIRLIVDLDREVPDFLDFHLRSSLRQKALRIWQVLTGQIASTGTVGPSKPLYDWVGFVEDNQWWALTDDLEVDRADLKADLEYPFEVYSMAAVNIGIAIVHRQRWTALGAQPGEVVRTIPLGPGQSEKVSTKVIRRGKTTTSSETTTEIETSSKTGTTSKDSSEVVREAASSENWNISASASYGIGGVGFGASLSGEYGGSSSKSSRDTSSSLSEAMSEAASKMRQQTKVVVATEREESFESSMESEVRNTNDEVPLTLMYHTLQNLYDVSTALQAVERVVFVPERLPAPYEIDAAWVRRYDWIIAAELIDESFRQTINGLITEENTETLVEYGSSGDPYASMLSQTRDRFASFDTPGNAGGLGGLDVADIFAEPQRQFDQYRRDEEARRRTNRLRSIQRGRLYTHIRDNILHYCRAIWAREDAEQRILRYRREGRTVPYVWLSSLNGAEAEKFVAGDVSVALGDVIDDITPVGFTGNYVTFRLRPFSAQERKLATLDVLTANGQMVLTLADVLDIMCARFTDATGTELRDPALDLFIEEAETLAPGALASLSDETVRELVSHIPEAAPDLIGPGGEVLRGNDGALLNPVSVERWGLFLLRRNGSRRFLVDSDNLYVSLLLGDGIALEPFKRAHRLLDVLREREALQADTLKNERRDILKAEPMTFDPDVTKVVVAGGVATDALLGGLVGDGDGTDGDGDGDNG